MIDKLIDRPSAVTGESVVLHSRDVLRIPSVNLTLAHKALDIVIARGRGLVEESSFGELATG